MIKIETLEMLKTAAILKKAVVCPTNKYLLCKPLPAAVVMNFTGEMILGFLEKGLFVYEKAKH